MLNVPQTETLNYGSLRRTWRRLLIVLLLTLLVRSDVLSQASKDPPAAELTPEIVDKRKKNAEALSNLDAKVKMQIQGLYQDALDQLKSAAASKQTTDKHTRDSANVKEDVRKIMSQRAALPDKPTIPKVDTLPEAEAELQKSRDKLKEVNDAFEKWKQEPSRRAARVQSIPGELATAKEPLEKITKELAALDPKKDALALAQHTLLSARQLAFQRKIEELEAERAYYTVGAELVPLRRGLLAQEVALATDKVGQLQRIVVQRQNEDVDGRIADALQTFQNAPPNVKPLAQENLRLARERKRVRERMESVAQDLEKAKKDLENLQRRRRRIEEKITAVGLTNVLGQLLLAERDALQNLRASIDRSDATDEMLQNLRLELFWLEEERAKLDDLAQLAAAHVSPKLATGHLERKQQFLDLLIADSNRYFYAVVELDSTKRQLVREVDQFAAYIEEHVLWTGSAPPLRWSDAKHAGQALVWLIGPGQWLELAQASWQWVWNLWITCGLAVAAVVAWLLLVPRMKQKQLQIGEHVLLRGWNQFWPTIHALGLTLALAALLPAALWLIGWRIAAVPTGSTLAQAIGHGLIGAARVLLLLMLVREVCRSKGLAGAHFGWTDTDLGKLRKYVRWLAIAVVPLTFLAGVMNGQPNPLWRDSLGRICFMASMLLIALLTERLLRPRSGLLYQVSVARGALWFTRLRYLWYVAGVGAPVSVALIAGLGYFYTAQKLTSRLEASVWLLFGLLLIASILLRWLQIARRWLALYQARRRQQAKKEVEEQLPPGSAPPPTEPEVDLTRVNEQTRKVLLLFVTVAGMIGLWLIWIDIFPALRFLDKVHLWTKTTSSAAITMTGEGLVTSGSIERVVPVTLFDLLIALLITAFTILAAHNVAGLLQMSLLERLPIDAGLRFTIVTIARYVLIIVGVILVSDRLGLAWSKVQWLVAALMVGLGFGLQEIFANFVSGIILLIERPIRVGDMVTVGNVTGTVNKIQLRATTIRDWNRREMVVPNKQLVTERLVNWTLTDSVYRVDLRVGIAYGSDTDLARQILLQIAAEHSVVLEKPTPKAIFVKFGDSALIFELRICIPHMDYWPRVVTEVNQAIDKRFKEAKIVIAFPQQDVHLHLARDGALSDGVAIHRVENVPQGQPDGDHLSTKFDA